MRVFVYYKNLGAYGVRYLFVTCGFLVAETEKLRNRFLLDRVPEGDHLQPFAIWLRWLGRTEPDLLLFAGLRTLV